MPGQVEQLEPVPSIETDGWLGYQHFTDPTRLPFNVLTYPSINCLIPSKDKLVPRKGKTLLGQEATVIEAGVHFDTASQGFAAVDYATKELTDTALEFGASANAYNSAVKVDDTHVLNFWAEETSNDLVAQVFAVDPVTGGLTALGSKLVIDTGFAGYNSCAALGDGQHFINFWSGSSNDGFVQVFNVNPSTFAVTALDTKTTFETGVAVSMSCVQVDANHFLNFWATASPTTLAQVAEVDLGTFAVTMIGSPLTVDGAAGNYNSCGMVNATHFINFWQGASNVGKTQVFAVNLSTYAVTAVGSPMTFDAVNASFNSCTLVNSSHFVNFWHSGSSGKTQAFAINLSTFAVTTVGSPFTFDGSIGTYNSCALVDSSGPYHVINFWRSSGSTGDLIAEVFSIDASTFAVDSMGGSLVYDHRSNTVFNSCVPMGVNADGYTIFVNFWGGTKADTTSDDVVALFGVLTTINHLTFSHGCGGINRMLWLAVIVDNAGEGGGDQLIGITYNGVAMTLSQKKEALGAVNLEMYIFYLVAPAVGTHDVVITTDDIDTSIVGLATSYTDALQEAPVTGNQGDDTGVTAFDINTLTTDPASMVVGFFVGSHSIISSNSNIRNDSGHYSFIDSGTVDIGTYSMSVTFALASDVSALTAIMAPISATDQAANWPPIGHKKRYTNDGGYLMEVRVTRTGDENLRDVIEVLLPDPDTDDRLKWYQITENINPLPVTVADRVYMDQFFDTNLNDANSRRNSRLVWVNGTNAIYSWSGGIALIGDVSGGEEDPITITTADGRTWRSLGFIPPEQGGTGNITIAGAVYAVTSGWSTDTLVLPAPGEGGGTGGIVVDDYAFSQIATAVGELGWIAIDSKLGNIDFCRQNKNYMFYGSFNTRQLLMSNAFGKDSTTEIINSQADLNDLIIPVTSNYDLLGICKIRVNIKSIGTPDHMQFDFQISDGSSGVVTDEAITGSAQDIAAGSIDTGVDVQFLQTTGHAVGDFWELEATQGVESLTDLATNAPAWANFWYSIPRVPGEGYVFALGANFWTMEPQEDDMYINDQFGNWNFINTQIAADLMSETISYQPLKQVSASKPIFPYMLTHMDNYLVFVTENKTLDLIGRREFLELPQMDYLSKPIQLDFEAATFHLGSMEYIDKRLWITSPRESVMLCYDNKPENKYWQPPQVITENGILSIVGNTLISHSNLRNQTFNLFTGNSDNGAAFTVRARTALTPASKNLGRSSRAARWDSKFSSNSFLEGYIAGNPELIYTIFRGVNDAAGISHIVKPVISYPSPDTASIGQGVLAGHPLGNDPAFEGAYFNEISRHFKPILNYYFVAIQIACTSKNHSYAILSVGLNLAFSPTGNNTLIGDREIL